MNVEQQQSKTLTMALSLFLQDFEVAKVYQLDTESVETRHFVLKCCDCKEDIDITLIQNGEEIWGAAVQMRVLKHLKAKHDLI